MHARIFLYIYTHTYHLYKYRYVCIPISVCQLPHVSYCWPTTPRFWTSSKAPGASKECSLTLTARMATDINWGCVSPFHLRDMIYLCHSLCM